MPKRTYGSTQLRCKATVDVTRIVAEVDAEIIGVSMSLGSDWDVGSGASSPRESFTCRIHCRRMWWPLQAQTVQEGVE